MIKVLIQTDKFKGGPSVFRSRIIRCFREMPDVEVVTDINGSFDIELCFIRKTNPHKKPYLLRVDGCYYITLIDNNKALKESIDRASFVVYQSEFSRQMCIDILKVNVDSTVIHNGIDQEYVDGVEKDERIEPGSFVSVSNRWRDNKRPNSTIRGFLEADTKKHLYIIGEGISDVYNSKYVHLLGVKNEQEIISIMKSCDYQIHLCHIDSCPNAVIEGLASGLNVLCTNLGGTKELVKKDGIVLEVDKWKRARMSKCILDSINPSIVANGIHSLMNIRTKPVRPDLDIRKVAEQYKIQIERVIKHV